MEPIIVGFIAFAVLFILMGLGLPIGFAMAIPALAGIWYLLSGSAVIAKMSLTVFTTISSYDLSVLPLFVFMASVIFTTGLGQDLYGLAAKWLGHQRGGLAMATIGGCAGFAAISSSSLATALTIGMVALPEMRKYKYHPSLFTACIAVGGPLGILIPPSGVLIMYGIITETSIGKLFAGGLLPGLLEAVLFIVTIWLICTWRPAYGPRGPKYSFKEKIGAFKNGGEIILLVILVLGGLIIGWFTPTESGAVGAFGAIILTIIRKRLNWDKLYKAIKDAMGVTGMFYVIIIGAYFFKDFMAVTTIPLTLGNWVANLALPPLGIMVMIILVYIVLGCFLDAAAMVLLTIPVFVPLIINLGFDPVWFGIVIVIVSEIGLITPPIGMIVFNVAALAPDIPITTIFKGVMPFLVADFVLIAILLFIPGIVTLLPNLLMSSS
jgi:C4-dicarboxylate transporter, DctM subunit